MLKQTLAKINHAALDSLLLFFVLNHSKWKFHSSSTIGNYTVQVYDADNVTYLGNFDTITLWNTDKIIKITPIGNNTSGADNYCSLYFGTYNDYQIGGAYCIGDQAYQVIPPTFTFASDDMTLSNTSATWSVASSAITLSWTPSGMATSPHANYINITKLGPVNILSTSRSICYNGVSNNTIPYTLSETVQNATNYLVTIDYSNV